MAWTCTRRILRESMAPHLAAGVIPTADPRRPETAEASLCSDHRSVTLMPQGSPSLEQAVPTLLVWRCFCSFSTALMDRQAGRWVIESASQREATEYERGVHWDDFISAGPPRDLREVCPPSALSTGNFSRIFYVSLCPLRYYPITRPEVVARESEDVERRELSELIQIKLPEPVEATLGVLHK